MASLHKAQMSFLRQQERSPSALTGWWTSCSLIGLLNASHNLGMWLIRLNLILEVQQSTIFWDRVQNSKVNINFGRIVPHSWKKLRAMWKILNAEYKAALSHFTLSGMHSYNFYEFCNEWHDIYYLQKQLESKPNLVPTVVADLT